MKRREYYFHVWRRDKRTGCKHGLGYRIALNGRQSKARAETIRSVIGENMAVGRLKWQMVPDKSGGRAVRRRTDC